MAKRKVVIDFGLWGALTAPSIPEIAGQHEEGAGGFKAFMPISDPSYPHVDDAEFLDGMREVKAVGGLVLVHAENDSLLQAGLARMKAEGRTDPIAHHESRPAFVEEEAVHRALYLAAHAGVRIQIVHVSSPVSAELVQREKLRGRPATMEICPHHLLLDLDDLVRLGPYGVCAPALRERALVERLWAHVLDGTADCLVSDHSAYTAGGEGARLGGHLRGAARLPGDPGDGAAGARRGLPPPGYAARRVRPLLVDQRRRASPASIPRKGTLLPGRDADIAIYDLDAEWRSTPRSQQFSKNPGRRSTAAGVRARVVRTLVRGETVYADGEILAEPGSGRFLSCHDDYALAAPPQPAAAR